MRSWIKPYVPFLIAAAVPLAVAQQSAAVSAMTMPEDRAEDSYHIYGKLIPLGETAGKDWPHALWLVRDTTLDTIPDGEACAVPPQSDNSALARAMRTSMNPHYAVTPSAEDREDYDQIMVDFDTHCHERIRLDAARWPAMNAPVRFLNEGEQTEFESTRFQRAPSVDKYKGAPALYGFSQVYFNARHTTALVYATHWCGGLCGQGMWVAPRKDASGNWKTLRWNAISWIS